jgi:hypothetical protein
MIVKTLRKDLVLTGCKDHKKGCYIKFSDKKVFISEERNDVVVDKDENGKIVGVEFYEGF